MPDAKPKLLLIGASGFIGGWLAELSRGRFDVIEASRGLTDRVAAGNRAIALDITDEASVDAVFEQVRPNAVILAAALADVDRCEREPDVAQEINVAGAVCVARQCRRYAARLLYTSTDAVFDGALGGYDEDAMPTPPNQYGRSKADAEAGIREILPSATIVRYSLVLGFTRTPHANSYLDRLASTLRAGQKIEVPITEFRNPIDIQTLAEILFDLIDRDDASGVFHIGATDKLARQELARRIAVALGCPGDLIQPLAALPSGRAKRSTDSFLICRRLPRLTGRAMPTCDEVIARAVQTSVGQT